MTPSHPALQLAAAWKLGHPRPEMMGLSFGKTGRWSLALMHAPMQNILHGGTPVWTIALRRMVTGPFVEERWRRMQLKRFLALMRKHGLFVNDSLFDKVLSDIYVLDEAQAAHLYIHLFGGDSLEMKLWEGRQGDEHA